MIRPILLLPRYPVVTHYFSKQKFHESILNCKFWRAFFKNVSYNWKKNFWKKNLFCMLPTYPHICVFWVYICTYTMYTLHLSRSLKDFPLKQIELFVAAGINVDLISGFFGGSAVLIYLIASIKGRKWVVVVRGWISLIYASKDFFPSHARYKGF